MRRVVIFGSIAVGLFVLVIAGAVALIESQEVVRIQTRDAEGETYTTRVWIADYAGRQWVAPGNRSNAWFQRLLVDPRVELVRNGESACYLATVVESPESIPVLEHFLEKYASVIQATSILNSIVDPEGDDTPPVAVRLDPCRG